MKTTLGGTIALAALTAAADAGAADMAVKAPPAPAPLLTNWSGWYAGVNVAWTRHHATTADVNGFGRGGLFPPPYVTPFFDSTTRTLGIGGQVGYNWQFNNLVVAGVEGDLNYVGAKTTFAPPTNNLLFCGPCAASATNELKWLATVRGRVGVTINNVLLYGTAGVAFGGVNNHWGYGALGFVGPGGFSDSIFSVDQVRTGFVWGGGVEVMAWSHWLVRVEAMRVDLGTSTATFTGIPPFLNPGTFTTRFTNTATIARAALSWKW
jgi:outer membrane immunogenic protein